MLEAFEVLFNRTSGPPLPLPPALQSLYRQLAFPARTGRPYLISNFVSTLDGVVSLGIPGKSGGGEISGFNPHDRALMGLLRAAADAVAVGAGTLRAVSRHLWTAEYAFPELGPDYQALRTAMGLAPTPLNVILSGSGRLDLSAPVFASGTVRTLLVTTPAGAKRLERRQLPEGVTVRVAPTEDGVTVGASDFLAEIAACLGRPEPLVLLEGGPRVMGAFFAARLIDELFLTLAPQVAGRGDSATAERPGLVSGRRLAPELPTWSALVSAHRADSHLFLRYQFAH
ncbi:MAG: dihydrofolate reductase family protein [Anaerolineales bacterium]|nr:dihydrofolate reductase family protein [Anaerolineales bacterium]